MKLEQSIWTSDNGWEPKNPKQLCESAQLVFLFGSTNILENSIMITDVNNLYKNAHIFGCSTSGEIYGTQVLDDSLVLTAVEFEHTKIETASANILQSKDSFSAGESLAEAIPKENLIHVLVLSDGLYVNGSDLVRGLTKVLPDNVTITGGLSGDGERFDKTLVINNVKPENGYITIVGLYGQRIKVGFGSLGGWDPFGPERLITRSSGNILFELDGKSALELYKQYLGEHADGLPATGLLFPLSLRTKEGETAVVRTILAIDENEQSMTFAGDLPEGAYARLMKANFDRLIDGAIGAAKTSIEPLGSSSPDLAILISCVGRKMVLKQRVEEEVEGVHEILGDRTVLTGFYSYGEISPFAVNEKCELHNQTMTITTLSER